MYYFDKPLSLMRQISRFTNVSVTTKNLGKILGIHYWAITTESV